MDALLEAEIELNDIEIEEGYMTITVDPTQLDDAKVVVEKLIPDVKFEVLEDKMTPNDEDDHHGEDLSLFIRLVTLLDEAVDVQIVYHNVSNLDEAE